MVRPSTLGHAVRRWLALALPVAALLFVLAGTASAEDSSPGPSAGPGASPAASASPSAGPSVLPTPGVGTDVPQVTPVPDPSLVPAPPLPSPLADRSAGGANTCYDCHTEVNPEQQAIAAEWKSSIHGQGGIGCADCHGGDPTSDQITVSMSEEKGFIGIPARDRTVGLCGACHSDVERMRSYNLPTDQYAKYFSSVHGQRLASSRDTRVAICVDCHGVHDIKKASDATSPVYPTNVPKLCASCHADAAKMKPYGIPTDQFAVYEQSVHGKALLGNADVRAPTCASCHGSHAAKPPRSTEVVEVCGKCHTATQALYQQSRHAELGSAAPKCWTCHGTHDVSETGQRMFFHAEEAPYDCVTCHEPSTKKLRLETTQFEKESDRRCDTCHHPRSTIYSQVEGIAGALSDAQGAYAAAEGRITEAARLGMIVNEAEVALSEAKTSLIQTEAAVHTTKLTVVAGLARDTVAKAGGADAIAKAKIDDSVFRREAMVVVVALIVINVAILGWIKRRLDRELEGRG